ncbi:MAG TPA: chorismate mutase [Candidatus Angelobacter sp.]|nr:chorismate mutase [Candidatus Angelobacter sp.]
MTKNGDELHERRKQIDVLDSELLRLLNQRARIACEVASIKKESSLPVYDGQREQQILDRICEQNQGPLDSQGLTSIFRCIIRESRKIEERSMGRAQENSFQQENLNGDQYGGKRIRS